jgi:hypothetical protein
MSHFAELDAQNNVLRVIVAESDFVETLPGRWVQTSYNTRGGVHLEGGKPLRKNYAGIGYVYDEKRDAFIPPKPEDAIKLDEESCLWVVPEKPGEMK